jgi:Carboxypeptidase regulatory-like domain
MALRSTVTGLLLASALSFPLWAAPSQRGQSFELRTVQGRVLNTQAMPARSAIVYLYDDRTQSVKTYIAGKNGCYRFSGLSAFDSYEIYAERGSMTSRKHKISNRNDRREFVVNLRIAQRG